MTYAEKHYGQIKAPNTVITINQIQIIPPDCKKEKKKKNEYQNDRYKNKNRIQFQTECTEPSSTMNVGRDSMSGRSFASSSSSNSSSAVERLMQEQRSSDEKNAAITLIAIQVPIPSTRSLIEDCRLISPTLLLSVLLSAIFRAEKREKRSWVLACGFERGFCIWRTKNRMELMTMRLLCLLLVW